MAIRMLLCTFALAIAPAVPAAAAIDEWAAQDCGSYVPVADRDANPEALPIRETSARLLAFARGLDDAHAWTGFTLHDVCRATRLPLRSAPLPPPRPEPWNPNPAPNEGASYISILQPKGASVGQYVEYRDLPAYRELRLSLLSDEDPEPSAESDRQHADMGERCELRADAVRDALTPAGFVMTTHFEAPDPSDTDIPLLEPSVSFKRGEVTVAVSMQGSYASQRAQQLRACVAGLRIGVQAP